MLLNYLLDTVDKQHDGALNNDNKLGQIEVVDKIEQNDGPHILHNVLHDDSLQQCARIPE